MEGEKKGENKEEVLVSVLIPCYNTVRYVEEAVRSIMAQTYRNMEIICVDDCSTDGTREVLERLAKEDSRIRLVYNKKNIGCTKTLNRGITLVRGKYIARMDSDDVSMPERIEKQVKYLEENKDISIVSGNLVTIDEDGVEKERSCVPTESASVFATVIWWNCVTHPLIMGRIEVFRKNPYDKRFRTAQDYELWCRLLYKKGIRIANIRDVLLKYRIHSANASTVNAKKQQDNGIKIQNMYRVASEEIFQSVFDTHKKYSSKDLSCAFKWLKMLDKYPMTYAVYKAYRAAMIHFMRTGREKEYNKLLSNKRCNAMSKYLPYTPLVSVLVPCYNSPQKVIEQAIWIIRCQTYENMEIICVEDATDDKTLELLANMEALDTRIKVFHNDKREGSVAVRNKCIALARGEYIAWWECVNTALPDRIKTEVDFLEAHKEIDIAGTRALTIDENALGTPRNDDILNAAGIFSSCAVFDASSMGRTNVYKKNLYKDGYPYAEDIELLCRLLYSKKKKMIVMLEDELLLYRQWEDRECLVHKDERLASVNKIQALYNIKDAASFDANILTIAAGGGQPPRNRE